MATEKIRILSLSSTCFNHLSANKLIFSAFCYLLSVVMIGSFSGAAYAATFTVDRTDDANVSTCTVAANDCTLRGAVTAANTAGGVDIIDFDGTVFATPQVISLTLGELVVTSTGTLTITGTGAQNLTVSGSGLSRVFANFGSDTTISGLTITMGNGTGATQTGFGGGIYNEETLTLDAVVITGNTSAAAANGGGIYNNGQSTPGVMTISASTIDTNTGIAGGGGILNFLGTINITNSTISGNMVTTASGGGGGIVNIGTLTANSITVASNDAVSSPGGGVVNGGTFNSQNSIYADNTAGSDPDFSGTLTSLDHNLIEDPTGTTITPLFEPGPRLNSRFDSKTPRLAANDITGVDPMLSPLADFGGPTRTHGLFGGSPAIDQGNSGALTTDQRGLSRPVDMAGIPNAPGGNAADIGAFESPVPTAATVSISGRVMTNTGRAISGAVVSSVDQNGNIISTRTNHFGIYRFTDVVVGQSLFLTVRAKRYSFASRFEKIFDDASDIDFIAQ